MDRTEVVVIGAGPTGLLLAAELALQNVSVRVLDRLETADPTIKAGSINVASAEILDRRGLLPALETVQSETFAAVKAAAGSDVARALGTRKGEGRFPVAGHFAGMLFRDDLICYPDPLLAAHTAVANGLFVPQKELEKILARHCDRLGVEISRGVEVMGVIGDTTTAAAEVILDTSAGPINASWVVAADGGRSIVRKQLAIAFDGTDPQMVGYQAIADISGSELLPRGWTWTSRGIFAFGPLPGRILVAQFGPQPADRNAPVTPEELEQALRDVSGADVRVNGVHGIATRWSDNARQARTYRQGRIFLAGDAAHVHSPFSGQGLNLGLGDAINLGWKLAATVKGWAAQDLLDTYETERHPIAARVLDWTRAQVALMRGDECTAQLRDFIHDELFTVPGAMNRVVSLTSGITQRYDMGESDEICVGTLAGDVCLGRRGRLADHAHDGRFVLIDRSPDSRFIRTAKGLEHRINAISDTDVGSFAPSLLVRPDGVITWADSPKTLKNGADENGQHGFATAVHKWVGNV